MVYAIVAKSGQIPRWHQLEHAIRRNFGGIIEQTPVEIFKHYFQDVDVSRGHYIGNHLLRDIAHFFAVRTLPYLSYVSISLSGE